MFLAPFTIQGLNQSFALTSEKVRVISNLERAILPTTMCCYLLLSSIHISIHRRRSQMALDSEVEWPASQNPKRQQQFGITRPQLIWKQGNVSGPTTIVLGCLSGIRARRLSKPNHRQVLLK